MEYSNSSNFKGLKITTGTNVCTVNNYSYSYGLDEETSKFLEKREEEKRLLQQRKALLQIAKHVVDISKCGCSYIEASKQKSK